MKKIALLLIALITLSCGQEEPKQYVTLSGKISNHNGGSLMVMGKNFKKEISISESGEFKDTMKVTDGFHGLIDGNKQAFLYLRNGYDLQISIDRDQFPGSVIYEGNGAITNNYLSEKVNFMRSEGLDNYQEIFQMDKEEFEVKMSDAKEKMDEMLAQADGLEPEVRELEVKANENLIAFYQENYDKEHKSLTSLQRGKPSPKFNYPDIEGKIISLDDLKGKYVYVDVWATWCGPCKREIPYLKELNTEYAGKDIAIVSLSIDKMEHKEKWMKMVREEGLKGIQIMADKDWRSEFVTAYNITGIPRFILIDPEGNIYDANAPRPSDPNLKEVLKNLNI